MLPSDTPLPMATPLADAFFWIAAFAILVAQAVILRSTKRGMDVIAPERSSERSKKRSTVLEWIFAVGPAVGLIVLLYFTRAAMHPTALHGSGIAPAVRGPRA